VRLAQEIRDLVERAKAQRGQKLATNSVLSVSQPQGEAAELLEPIQSDLRVSSLVFTPSLRERVDRILAEQQNLNRLKEHNLRPRQRLLFTGPPGCGKTMTASALSSELHLPLFVIRLDSYR
jgi:SpoVK/Ycf46/Vps4 family AAA+-type ATPase